jgi:hypothetical protein
MVARRPAYKRTGMNPAPRDDANKTASPELADPCNIAKEAANQALRCLGPNPDKRMRQKVLIEFRHGLFPTGSPDASERK